MIVKMRKLMALSSKDDYREVLKNLTGLGCVELESAEREIAKEAGELVSVSSVDTGSREAKAIISSAVKSLDRYSPHKVSMLAPRDPLNEKQLFDKVLMERGYKAAKRIKEISDSIDENNAKVVKAENKQAFLEPWKKLDVPLNEEGTRFTAFLKGVIPSEANFENVKKETYEVSSDCELTLISTDREQHYITVLVHVGVRDDILEKLKKFGFTHVSFSEFTGTASENIELLKAQQEELKKENEGLVNEIKELSPMRKYITAAYDAFTQEAVRDELSSTLAMTKKTVVLTGWVPSDKEETVAALLKESGCAWEFSDPAEGDDVPVAYKTNKFAEPFVGITDMYGTPPYNSIVDPNPLMSIFYFTFFGFMMCDAMYGILIFLGSLLALKMKRPSGSMQGMLKMFMYCGISTFIAGALTGGWFADSVSAVSLWLTGTAVSIPPLWFDPLKNPMMMLAFSLALGAIQLITGMALAGYRMIKQGHLMDAVFDIGSWWVLFAGIAIFGLLGAEWGLYVALAGALMLLLTGGRKKKGLGKITGGLGSLYNITSYVSDLLSYSRIMALGLSGAVVGQVVNKIATMAHGVKGIVLFIFVFIFGHIFNIAVSLLGAYVHSSRLQYIEFYGKFFDDGGRAFKPLSNNTKYVEIIKE